VTNAAEPHESGRIDKCQSFLMTDPTSYEWGLDNGPECRTPDGSGPATSYTAG